jgi:3',5'-cyclic AMP phosphodiesterase CpdA
VQNDNKSLGSTTLREAYQHFGHEASFMVFAGDLVSKSTDDYWDEFFYAGGWIFGSLPSLPTPGNHEYNKLPDGTRSFSNHWNHIFGMPQNPPLPEYQDRFYFVDYQGVRFISLDASVTNESNKNLNVILAWFEETLKTNTNKWTVVLTHYPVYSCSAGRNNEEYRNILRPLLEKYGVDLVLQGHDHTYCRGFNKANIQGNVKNPPLYVVSVAGPKM